MLNEKLKVNAISDKIDIEDVEVQDSDPCKNNKWAGVYDCYIDCAPITKGGRRTPKASTAY